MCKIKNDSQGRKRNPIINLQAILISLVLVAFTGTLAFGDIPPSTSPDKQANKELLEKAFKMQMPFIPNQGQIADEHVRFYAQTLGGVLSVTESGEMVYSFTVVEPQSGPKEKHSRRPSNNKVVKSCVLKEKLVANSNPVLQPLDESKGKANYLIGNDKSKWKTGINTYNIVSLGEVYKGIEFKLKAYGNNVEKIFTVKPGADPNAINLEIEGATSLNINDKGELEVGTGLGAVKFAKPLAYQEVNGERHEVKVAYLVGSSTLDTQHSSLTYGFKVGDYDKSVPLIIDPLVVPLVYSSYLGGSGYDEGIGIAVDSYGNAYITGETQSATGFPTMNAIQSGLRGFADAFVTKIDATGALVYSTFFGGDGGDWASAIAVDTSGNAYITGLTDSTNFPTTSGAYQVSLGGLDDAFVTKLNATGALAYSTYLGGSGGDYGHGIAVDNSGNAYITGNTASLLNFPTTGSAYQLPPRTSAHYTAFFTKISPAGTGPNDLVYSTYLGGTINDVGLGIAVDSFGNAYITGYTNSTNFPLTAGAYQLANNAGGNHQTAFFTKMNPAANGANSLVYSTYLGGTGNDWADAIAVDSSGNAYITGLAVSSNFPTKNPYQSTLKGPINAFVTKINPAGTGLNDLVYSTFLGGSGQDSGEAIAVDSTGNAYVAGQAGSSDFPTKNPIQGQGALSGPSDGFVTKINAAGNDLVYSTYLGGNGNDRIFGIAVDSAGNAYVTGDTDSTNFLVANAFQSTPGGGTDAFVAKIGANIISCTYSIYPNSVSSGASAYSSTVSVTAPAGCAWIAISSDLSWINFIGTPSGSGNGSFTYTIAQNYGPDRTGTITVATETFSVQQYGPPPPCSYSLSSYSALPPASGGSGYTVNVTADAGCGWSAVSNDPSWITITGGSSGTGNGTVTYSVGVNSGSARTGTMTIAGYTFTVNQAAPETISTPNTPTGPANGFITSSYNFTTGGSVSSYGHTLQYQFDWGDGGPLSNWGAATQIKWWNTGGTYNVKARARCATDYIESGWSSALQVHIAQSTNVTGSITTNTTWTYANSPYVVINNVTVNSGVTLTIEPGVVVKFTASKSIVVNGTLNASGTNTNIIYFTSINDNSVGDATGTGSPARTDWRTVVFSGSGSGTLDFCELRYGGDAGYNYGQVTFEGVGSINATITNTVIKESGYHGLLVGPNKNVTVSGCTFENNNQWGIVFNNSPPNVSGSIFSNNGSGGIDLTGNSSTGQISTSTFSGQPVGIRCENGANPIIGASVANSNTFSGNTTYGVQNIASSVTVNATYNNWGSDTGPSGVGPGTGDPVSNYVDFDPWIGKLFTLTVTKSGTGSGLVISLDKGILCGPDCSESYDPGTIVDLTARPAPGSYFAGWSDGTNTSQALTWKVTMNALKNVTATFTDTPPPVTTWAKTYGGSSYDTAQSIQQTSDGGYIVAGHTASFGVGGNDIWVLKLDSDGNVNWQKTYGGTNDDIATSVEQTSDGGYIVSGYTYSFGAGYTNIWVLKLDSDGNVNWQKTYGGTLNDYGFSIQQTSDGGYIVAGFSVSFGHSPTGDFWVLKLNSDGSVNWQKTYGGLTGEYAYSVKQTSDGGYIVAGYTDLGPGNIDVWVLKLDSDGNINWQKTYGGTLNDYGLSIQQTSDGGYILAGFTNSFGAGNNDILVLKLNSDGSVNWQKSYGGTGDDRAYSVEQTSDGGYIVGGRTNSFGAGNNDILVLKLNSDGSVNWQKSYGGTGDEVDDSITAIKETSDSGYVVATTTASFGASMYNLVVMKLDSNGDILGCPGGLIGISSAVVGTPTITVTSSTKTVADSLATISNTSVTPITTSVTPGTVCTGIPCSYSILPTSDSYPAGGGGGSVSVTAPADCTWTSVSNDSWIIRTSGASGSGNGIVDYLVAINSGAARTGTMTIAGQTFTVTQEAPAPTYTLNVSSNPAIGGAVVLSPPGGSYAPGTSVQIQANFASGYFFYQWSGDLTGSTNPVMITMTANKTITATFLLSLGDDDHDGYSNAREVALGTDPNNPLSYPTSYVPDAERAALIDLYNSTIGSGWYQKGNWTDPNPAVSECSWYGVTCTGNHVTSLDLHSNNLVGTIPASLSNLTNLQFLYLNSNQLTGGIPAQLGSLTSLLYLGLDSNQLTGSIPTQLGSLTNLRYLNLWVNQLSGSIPIQLGSLTNLVFLGLSVNQLTGSIPAELGNLMNLQYLGLDRNQLSGSIPASLGNLTNLQELYLYNNQLTGSIPPELSNLTNLQVLHIGHNQLTGSIPAWLGNLPNLQSLHLGHNQLTGSIPTELGNLANLQTLHLGNNSLTGSVPSELGNLTKLQDLHLLSNQLTGAIPVSLTNLTSLVNGGSELGWNALYTTDNTLRAFLNQKQAGGNWESTQTVAPTNLTATPLSSTSVQLIWTPIVYTGDTGGYEIWKGTPGGTLWILEDTTSNKSANTYTVNNLTPDTPYAFKLRTVTNPHANNQNTVYGEYTAPTSTGDGFDANLIDRTVWTDLEFVRRINNGVFESALTRYGSNGSNYLVFSNSGSVNSFSADVTVTAYQNNGSYPHASLLGFVYNDGTPGDGHTGDVLGIVGIGHNGSLNRLEGFYTISRCTAANCNLPDEYDQICTGLVDPSFSPSLNTAYTLSFSWDGASSITFGIDDKVHPKYTKVINSSNCSGLPSSHGAPRVQMKGISTRIAQINGSNDGGYIAATFDNVHVNGGPYDNFESSPINKIEPALWTNFEFVRAASGGELVSELTQRGVNGTNNTSFVDSQHILGFEADLKVLDFQFNAGFPVRPLGRLYAALYNDGTGNSTPGDLKGDVIASVGILDNGQGLGPQAFYSVSHCLAANCNLPDEYEILYSNFFKNVGLDETHTFSIAWDGLNVAVGCDGNVVSYNPTSLLPVGGPAKGRKGIGTRVTEISNTTEWAYVAASFDNVVITQTDTNLDGMADSWEMANFGTLAVNPNGDPDHDGLTNLQEYQYGTNPNQANGPYTISATAGAGGGITPSGAVTVNYRANQTFNIALNSGYHIEDVLVDGVSQGAITSYTFTNVTAGHSISVAFASDTFTITASAGLNGSIAPSGAVSVNYGSDQTFTIAPDPGYHVESVSVDGGALTPPPTTYTFTNVSANHTISATFSINATISSINPDHGTIADNSLNFTLYGTGFNEGTTVQLTNFVLIDPTLPNPGSIDATVDTVGGTSITGRFDLTKAGIGQYDVVVTNPDGQSAILSKGFTVLDTNPPVTTAIPRGATYNASLSVTLLTNEPATIYYTTNGTEPTLDSASYTNPIPISATTTLKFFAIDAESKREATKTEIYTMDTRFGAIAVLDPQTPELIIPVTSIFTFPSGTRAIVVDCHKVNHTLRDSEGNVLPMTDYLKHYVIGPPDTPGSDVKTYSGDVPVTCDLAQLYPPEALLAGNYTLEVNYSNFFQPPGIHLFQGSISAAPIPVHVAALITTHIVMAEAGPGGSILLSDSVVSGPVLVRHGSSPTFAIARNPGYQVQDVLVDGVSQGAITSYTFTNVTADHTISATFSINPLTISSITPNYGTIADNSQSFTLSGAGFNAETTVQLTNFVLIDPSLPNPGSIDATVGTVGGTSITGQFDLTKAGIGQYDVVVTNPDGQSAILTKGFTVLDTLAPVTTAFPRGAIYNAPLSVTLLTNEPATIYYSIGGAFVEYTAPINISSNTTLQFYAIDAAGNGEATKTETYTMDARFGAIAVLDSPTPELIIPVTSTFTFPSAGTQAIVVDCHKVNHTLRDSNGNVLPITDYLKHYVIGDPDTPGSDVITYSGDVSITCDLAKLYPPEVLFAGDYTLEVNYSNFFQPPGIQLFQGSISAVPILVHVAEAITTHIITTEAGAGGSILLSGSAVSGPVVVRRGSSPTFTITPNQGYQIDDVKVDNVSQGRISSYTFSDVRADHTISATFAINTFTITASAGAGGSITPSGTVIVNYGDSKAFTIAPNPGYHIVNVMVDNVSKGAISSYTFSDVRAGHTISATFASNTYTITATAGANGSITPSGTVTVNYGANKTFTIKPNTSYHVADVLVDGVSVDAVTTYTFKGVSANHTISATFAINTYVLTVTKAGTGSGNVTASIGTLVWNGNVGTATYPAGTKVTLTATANEGSTFTGWSASCSGTGSCSTVIIGSKVTMNMCGPCKATATFRKK